MADWVLAILAHFGPHGTIDNLVLAILVDFGSLWLHLVLTILVRFGKYDLLVNLAHTIHSINVVHGTLDNFILQKKIKYLTEIKTLIKIPIVFKNLF